MLRVVFHAPTPEALDRARRNLLNFRVADPEAELVIIANAGAVSAALANPDPDTDAALLVCRRTLANAGITNQRQLAETDSAVVEIARRQAKGWQYIRS
ncbi:DsrE family protein [Spiribacter pallidus]|uniref:Intracellular sulfur oxidation protein, DsrE/DsrF family n=1 Tax=Spiribacter pallidus TaxID=1987936 RepID=A0ABV3T9B5_9GAMM